MSLEDKIKNNAENLGGKAKEVAGDVSGDKDLKAEGKADQVSAQIKDKVSEFTDKAKDVAEEAGANLKLLPKKSRKVSLPTSNAPFPFCELIPKG